MAVFTASKAADTGALSSLLLLADNSTNYSGISGSGFVAQLSNDRLTVEGSGFTNDAGTPSGGTISEIVAESRIIAITEFEIAFTITGLAIGLDTFVASMGSMNTSQLAAAYLFNGDDIFAGSPYVDRLYAFGGNDRIGGGEGSDFVYGNAGADRANGGADNDQVFGGTGNDIIGGNAGDDFLGGEGARDILRGGPGKDGLNGGRGWDQLVGGTGPDTFTFEKVIDSLPGVHRDVIRDFRHGQGDKIDLSWIDAVKGLPDDQDFVFVGGATFAHYRSTHPGTIGMVRYADGIVQANVNGNLKADFEIKMIGAPALVAGDFVL